MASRCGFVGLVGLLGYASFATAQSTGLADLAAMYPTCSLNCMVRYIPQSPCITSSGIDQTCLCTNEELNKNVTICASEACTVKELLSTMNATSVACQQPVRDHGMGMIISNFVLGAVALVTFIIRIVTRLKTQSRGLYADDWLMLAAVTAAGPPTIMAWFLTENDLGRDMWKLEHYQITNVLEFFFLGELFYVVSLTLIKISILAFFHRVFPTRNLQLIIRIVIGVCAAYGITFFFVTLLQCQPINYMWHQWHGEMPGRCNNINIQGWVAAALSIFLDLVILAIPLKPLYHLELSLQKRISIMLMFAVGSLAAIIAIIKLKYLVQFRDTTDPTYDYHAPGYWSLFECQVGIICANMPAIYQLIKTWMPKLVSGTTRGSRSKSHGTAPTLDMKGSIVNGKFTTAPTPTVQSMPCQRNSSDEYLQWRKEVEPHSIELGHTRHNDSPSAQYVRPGTAF